MKRYSDILTHMPLPLCHTKRRIRYSIVLLCALLSACAGLGPRTIGKSGPVAWMAADMRVIERQLENGLRDVYTFSLVLTETQGTKLTFTEMEISVFEEDVEPSTDVDQGEWVLQPYGEVRWPFTYYTACQEPASYCDNPSLGPSYDIVLKGTDDRGRPVRVDIDLILPVNPRDKRVVVAAHPSSADAAKADPPAIDSSVPVHVVGNSVLVQGLLNGKEKARLLLDTGASHTVLTPAVAKRLKIEPGADAPRRTMHLVSTATLDVAFVQLKSLRIGDAVVEDLEVGVTEVAPEAPFLDGLLGHDFLSNFTTELNHAKSRLRLKSPSSQPTN